MGYNREKFGKNQELILKIRKKKNSAFQQNLFTLNSFFLVGLERLELSTSSRLGRDARYDLNGRDDTS